MARPISRPLIFFLGVQDQRAIKKICWKSTTRRAGAQSTACLVSSLTTEPDPRRH